MEIKWRPEEEEPREGAICLGVDWAEEAEEEGEPVPAAGASLNPGRDLVAEEEEAREADEWEGELMELRRTSRGTWLLLPPIDDSEGLNMLFFLFLCSADLIDSWSGSVKSSEYIEEDWAEEADFLSLPKRFDLELMEEGAELTL